WEAANTSAPSSMPSSRTQPSGAASPGASIWNGCGSVSGSGPKILSTPLRIWMSRWRTRTWDQGRWAHERDRCGAVRSLDTLPAIPDPQQLRALAGTYLVPAPCHRCANILPVRYPHFAGGTVALLLYLHLPRASSPGVSPLWANTPNSAVLYLRTDHQTP